MKIASTHCSISIVLLVVINCYFVITVSGMSGKECLSCGTECTIACGTRSFRTCCFNYLRKRGNIPHHGLQDLLGSNADSSITLTTLEIIQLKRLLKVLLHYPLEELLLGLSGMAHSPPAAANAAVAAVAPTIAAPATRSVHSALNDWNRRGTRTHLFPHGYRSEVRMACYLINEQQFCDTVY